jgi:hypothetical protein
MTSFAALLSFLPVGVSKEKKAANDRRTPKVVCRALRFTRHIRHCLDGGLMADLRRAGW